MALEELFKNVTKRFNDDAPEEHEPVFKCPRCQNVMFMDDYKAGLKVCSAKRSPSGTEIVI